MFLAEKGQEEIYQVAKVFRLSQIAIDLKKKVKELKAQQRPSTPPEVLEKQKKTTSEDVDRTKAMTRVMTKGMTKGMAEVMMWETHKITHRTRQQTMMNLMMGIRRMMI